jgi:hypothetical protein
MEPHARYRSYLLRLWQAPGRGEPRWLASLEVPGTGERQGFSSLQALFSYLEVQAQEDEAPAGRPPASR